MSDCLSSFPTVFYFCRILIMQTHNKKISEKEERIQKPQIGSYPRVTRVTWELFQVIFISCPCS